MKYGFDDSSLEVLEESLEEKPPGMVTLPETHGVLLLLLKSVRDLQSRIEEIERTKKNRNW